MAVDMKMVYVSGLNIDFRGNPFETVKFMLEHSDNVEILQGECAKCNNTPSYTFRTNSSDKLVLIGDNEDYQALCSVCFEKHRNK